MSTALERHRVGARLVATLALVISSVQSGLAAETLLSGFNGDFSSATGTDWTSDGLTTQSFVTGPGNGVTQGTGALSIQQPPSPPQLVDMKLITLDNVPLVAANDTILMDVTVPENVGARSIWLSFRADGLFANSPELFLSGDEPERSGTVVWNYAAEGLKDFAENFMGTFWTIAIGVRGNDFNGGQPITTIVDNIRFQVIPEPTSCVLVALALIGLTACRVRMY